jgi:hypothetical protein
MKNVDGQVYLTIGEVAKRINRIPQTLKNWISWYETQAEEVKAKYPLPQAITDQDTKGTRYFREEDVALFDEFKKSLQYGTMAEFSITRWGKRGEDIKHRREEV